MLSNGLRGALPTILIGATLVIRNLMRGQSVSEGARAIDNTPVIALGAFLIVLGLGFFIANSK